MQRATALVALSTVLVAAGCAQRSAPHDGVVSAPCMTAGQPGAAGVSWIRPSDPDDVASLEAWCQAVGPAVVTSPANPDLAPADAGGGVSRAARFAAERRYPRAFDSLAVLVWNTHVGGGDARSLIADLRAGRLTDGAPVRDFVLLLQEVHRTGSDVPASPPGWGEWAGRIASAPEGSERLDVTRIAELEGLNLFYAPSMRNGAPGDDRPAEDRGNAILATVPLTGPTAVELPHERQRRVALIASVAGLTTSGSPWRVRLVSAHLDNRAPWSRFYRSFGAAQSNQVRGLIRALRADVPTVVGADLNTWYSAGDAGATRLLQNRFASLETPPTESTASIPLLPDLRLDHLFFGVPEGWSARYRVIENRYGSDHKPLLGWVGPGSGPAIRQAVVGGDPSSPGDDLGLASGRETKAAGRREASFQR